MTEDLNLEYENKVIFSRRFCFVKKNGIELYSYSIYI